MARYYGVFSATTGAAGSVQSAAAQIPDVAPSSLASLYAQNLAAGTAQATAILLPTSLGGIA